MAKKTNIYERLEELHLRARVLFTKSGDSYLYTDAGCTEKITGEELRNLFGKGLVVISIGTGYAVPVSLEMADGYASVNVVTTSSNTVALTPYYSGEYTES